MNENNARLESKLHIDANRNENKSKDAAVVIHREFEPTAKLKETGPCCQPPS